MLKEKIQQAKPYIGFTGSCIAVLGGVREWYVRKIDTRFDEQNMRLDEQNRKMEQFQQKIQQDIKDEIKQIRQEIKEDMHYEFNRIYQRLDDIAKIQNETKQETAYLKGRLDSK